MTKEEWQQDSFLPPVHLDIGIAKPRAKRRRKRAAANPDQAAVNRFLGRQRRALYDETGQTAMSSLLSLTSDQLLISCGFIMEDRRLGQKKRLRPWHKDKPKSWV